MTQFKELQGKHERLIEAELNQTITPEDAQDFYDEIIDSSNEISSSRERDQLRAYSRYWANHIYEKTKIFPKAEFLPSPVIRPRIEPLTIASIIAAVLAIIVFLLATYELKPSPPIYVVNITTPSPEISTPDLTTRKPEGGTPTTPYPTPFKGSLTLTAGLSVQQWNIEYVCQKGVALSVKILGVKISGEFSSYEITFQQISETPKSIIVYPTDEIATFIEPILIDTGTYVHVTIRPNIEDRSVLWIDDLFFPLSLSPPGICK